MLCASDWRTISERTRAQSEGATSNLSPYFYEAGVNET